jgi:UDP-N-acetylmuramoyl-tripeptide--D-alanyl-D-alanine ligase
VTAISVGELSDIIGGELHGDPREIVSGAVVDSRLVTPGVAFVAIAGEQVDGHDFAEVALGAGAVVAITTRILPIPCIVVPDPIEALGQWARWWRNKLAESGQLSVIAITGSSGKTSTKDLLATVLQSAGTTVAAHGSLNTEVGVPLSVLAAPIGTRFLVLEMGMRGPGHIRYLCSVASPDIAVITNVGSAHLGVLGSRGAIAQAKAEILEGLADSQCAIVPAGEPLISAELYRTSARVVTFGEGAEADVRAENVGLDDQARAHFELVNGQEKAHVSLAVHGEHFVSNALAVAAVAREVGIPLASVAELLSVARIESKWRMEVTTTPSGITLINDAYNANPESMRAALKSLASMRGEGRTWAVLGEMLELGADSVEEHDAIGRLAVRLDISQLICVGAGTRVMHLGASNEGSWGEESRWVPDAESALAILRSETRRGDVVLVKASRGIGLETVAAALSHEAAGAHGGDTA